MTRAPKKTASKKAAKTRKQSPTLKTGTNNVRVYSPGTMPLLPAPTLRTSATPILPTVRALASLAAAMATPVEEPGITADRALALWQACRHTLCKAEERDWLERNSEPYRGAYSRQWVEFLAACDLTPESIAGSKKKNISVPLKKFLEACKITHETDIKEFLSRWQAMRKREVAEYNATLGDTLVATDGSYPVPSDPEERIPGIALQDLWHSCARFIENDCAESDSEHGKMMARRKQVYAAARAVIAGMTLKPEQKQLLKNLTPEEVTRAIAYLKMNEMDAGKWQDANRPQSARPKKSSSLSPRGC